MTDDNTGSAEGAGTDRRTALKRAAVAAGVVAWTTPVVIAATPGIAHAGTRSTNCRPTASFDLVLTESNCSGVPADQGKIPPACCSNLTYFLVVSDVDCGARCDEVGKPVVTIGVLSRNGVPLVQRCPGFFDLANCNSQGTIDGSITIVQQCGDGITYTCTFDVDFTIGPSGSKSCPDFLPGTVISSSCVP